MPIPKNKKAPAPMSAKERIYTTLEKWIIDGVLEPNEQLNESELADYFSVSRTPLREALQMLNEQRLVCIMPSTGTFVAPIDKEEMKKVYPLLGELQAFALSQCVETASEADYKRLENLNQTFLSCAQKENVEKKVEADYQFHLCIAKLSDNSYLVDFTDRLLAQTRRVEMRFFSHRRDANDSYLCHKEIIDSMRNHHLEEAQELVRSNWLFLDSSF